MHIGQLIDSSQQDPYGVKRIQQFIHQNLSKFFIALCIGIPGGALFSTLSLPLAWMMGAMLFVTGFALAGVQVAVPNKVRSVFVAILGVMLGSAFTPDLVNRATEFGAALIVQITYMVIAGVAAYGIYRLIARYDVITAYFSSTPGGLSEMTLMGEHYGADARIISLNHAVRVLIIVTVIPFYFRWIEGLEVPASPPNPQQIWTLLDVMILVGCGAIGYPAAVRLKLPAAALIGPMVLSAAAHISGLTASSVPGTLIAASQLIVGTALGCRFTNRMSAIQMVRVIAIAALAAIVMIAVAIALVSIASLVIPVQNTILFLSLAPGGLAEMSLIALAFGTGTAFVTVMHFIRVAIVMLLGAAVYRVFFDQVRR